MTTPQPTSSPAGVAADARKVAADVPAALGDADQLIRDAQNVIVSSGHSSREISLVLTKLDEAVMWLHSHLTHTEK